MIIISANYKIVQIQAFFSNLQLLSCISNTSQIHCTSSLRDEQFFSSLPLIIYQHSKTLKKLIYFTPHFPVILLCDYLSLFPPSHSTLLQSLTLTCDSSFRHSQRQRLVVNKQVKEFLSERLELLDMTCYTALRNLSTVQEAGAIFQD